MNLKFRNALRGPPRHPDRRFARLWVDPDRRSLNRPMAGSAQIMRRPWNKKQTSTNTEQNMNTALELRTHANSTNGSDGGHEVNLTRGASHFGIPRYRVLVPREVLIDYAESDPALGYNLAGEILRILASHVSDNPGGRPHDIIMVGARRREDDRSVELHLKMVHLRRQGQETLLLFKVGERAASSPISTWLKSATGRDHRRGDTNHE